MNLSKILPLVSRPARYLGNEWNSIHKNRHEMEIAIALAFPDLYEVGMSHLGLAILYHLLNQIPEIAAERVYAPWVDMENLMRQKNIPLFTLESQLPVREVDIFGFTLPYELCYTNILNMLDLAGLPLKAKERNESHPLVIAGGVGAFNAEPLADFLDVLVLGDGEEIIIELIETYKTWKKSKENKQKLLYQLSQTNGIYIPSLYKVNYKKDNTVKSIEPQHKNIPTSIKKRIIPDLNQTFYPTAQIVPYLDIVHDRITLEIMRGCSQGCRFCQAGILYRPVRERTPETLLKIAEASVESTGYEEISLSSLSSGDYSCLEELMKKLWDRFGQKKITLSLPSLHVDDLPLDLARKIAKGKKPGFTFAPEVGSERLRRTINKNIREEDLLTAANRLAQAGWRKIKLYFMIGLPGETQEDIEAIVTLARKLSREKINLNISISSFVPKAHTPFQWESMESLNNLKEKQTFLRDKLKVKRIKVKWHDVNTSFLEAVFARGDRKLGDVLHLAWLKGCRFDGWNEHFRFDLWMEAFRESGIDPYFYTHRQRSDTETLPWDHLNTGVKKKYLLLEKEKARQSISTSDCRLECHHCGITICKKPLPEVNICANVNELDDKI